MKRLLPRRRLVTATAGIAVLLAAAMGAFACTAKWTPVGPGGECFLATDCAPGLICVEQPNKTRICTDDLSRVAGRPPADAGGEQEDGPEGGADGGEAGVADSGTVSEDSGSDPDTGASPDTGPPPVDASGD